MKLCRSTLSILALSVLISNAVYGTDNPETIKPEEQINTGASDTGVKVETLINKTFDKKTEIVSFNKGNTKVTNSEKKSLKALVKSIYKANATDKIYVAAWADEVVKDGQLGPKSVALASNRLGNVVKELKRLKVQGDFYLVNVAEEPNKIETLFKTDASQLKDSVQNNTNTGEADLNGAAQNLRSRGGPGKVVVYIHEELNTPK